jgi:hypothetical protein
MKSIENYDTIYVKRWKSEEGFIKFKLSNKLVQVNFDDLTEIKFYCKDQKVMIRNSTGCLSTFKFGFDLCNED